MTEFYHDVATAADHSKFSALWLQALVTDPACFLDAIDHEIGNSSEDWARKITKPNDLTLLGYTEIDPNEPDGIVSVNIGKNYALIHGLYVKPSYRRNGLGSYLVESAIDAARSKGMPLVRAQTLYGNEPAQKLFENCGFDTRGGKLINRSRYGRQFGGYTHDMNVQ